MFKNSTLLITGGTGSFGNIALKTFIDKVKEIRIFSRDEKKQNDMRLKYKNDKIKFIIGDVRSYSSIYSATRGVDYIFHAAALKQVPVCEFFPIEAVRTNILGAENVLNASVENKVKTIVVLSTDKAVYPINAMGISKAMMEKLVVAKSRTLEENTTTVCCTRYGNVMASRGSVIPLFVEQIKKGESLTITDPDMTRFLMSLDDALNLASYAFENAQQGDIFIHKAPAATIGDLAVALKEIFEVNNEIKLIGVRHGEKKHETLVTKEEMLRTEENEKYYKIKADQRQLNYKEEELNKESSYSKLDSYTSFNTRRLNVEEIKELLLKLDYVKKQL